MKITEADGKTIVNLIAVAWQAGAVRGEGAAQDLTSLKNRIIAAFTEQKPELELIKND